MLGHLALVAVSPKAERRADGGPQDRQMPAALDPVQPRLDVEERRGHPALLLVAVAPVVHPVRSLSNERHDRLQAVRRLQASPQDGKDPQAMERQGLLQAFVQALHRRAVEQLKLFAKPPERPLGPLVSGLIISRLEFPPDAPLPALGPWLRSPYGRPPPKPPLAFVRSSRHPFLHESWINRVSNKTLERGSRFNQPGRTNRPNGEWATCPSSTPRRAAPHCRQGR